MKYERKGLFALGSAITPLLFPFLFSPQVLLSIIEKEALKSPIFLVELFFPFNSVRGCFVNLEFLILDEYMFIGVISWLIDIFSLYNGLCLL